MGVYSAQDLFFFPAKIFIELFILFILSPLPHIFIFFYQGWGGGGNGKIVFSSLNFFYIFPSNRVFFSLPPPLAGQFCRIYTTALA